MAPLQSVVEDDGVFDEGLVSSDEDFDFGQQRRVGGLVSLASCYACSFHIRY